MLSATGAASKTTSEVNRFQQEKETARCRTTEGPCQRGMEGKGAYNRNAAIPSIGRRPRHTALRKSGAADQSSTSGDRPIVIADYGSSQGKANSLAPMRAAIAALRMRAGRQRPIFVCHTDLPANDFSEMFALLESDRKATCRRTAGFSHMRSAARFIGAYSRPVTSISDGVPTRPSGSAKFTCKSGPLLHSVLHGRGPGRVLLIAKRHGTGRHP